MRFIGTKIITAEPMTRAAYNQFRGWPLPADENGADDGYLVEYEPDGKPNVPGRSGYVSWSPKAVLDAAYRRTDALTFGLAVEAMKRGARVARSGWNGAGQWIALGEGRRVFPEALWNKHTREFAQQKAKALPRDPTIAVLPYFILKNAQDDILMGWSPSQSDALAEDWQIVDQVETKTYADGTTAIGQAPLPDASPAEQERLQRHADMVRESGWTTGKVIPSATLRPAILPPALPPHQKRVIDEKRELDERKEKLEAFFDTPTFAQLDADEQGRLHAQRGAMAAYARILSERISAFAGEDAVLDASSSPLMRSRDTDDICGLCDEFDVDQAAPELAAQGMGRCLVRDERGPLALHVACGDGSCVSFRLDRPNLRRRRQFVEVHRRVQDTDQ